ncbi:hypothetical protein DUI87_28814 [Hirundo rustica rustica]|uniref:Uncharacterized protein n=1 Tax=Hirundo rustica rustica TaxID=333673 RepID=A0A3M0IZQ9_HIRRU|nr:hypothetical protein DUI87_28814 [Hirundo rustica rustica]
MDNTANKELQFSYGNRYEEWTVVLFMGFSYSFVGLLEFKRAAEKSCECNVLAYEKFFLLLAEFNSAMNPIIYSYRDKE